MKEIIGNLWDHYGKSDRFIALTINGTIKANGSAVMGRGCAWEATKRFPAIANVWGQRLRDYGLKTMYLYEFDVVMFPVKFNWWEQASLTLIEKSAKELLTTVDIVNEIVVLPRPGCGNGRLTWEQVKPLLVDLPDNVWIISHS